MSESIDHNKLTGDYKTAYIDIVCYLQTCDISSEFSQEVKNDLKDMLFSSQKDQVSVKSIIGKDIKHFCENIIEPYSTKKLKIVTFLNSLNFTLAVIGIISLMSLTFGTFKGFMNLSVISVFLLNWFIFKHLLNFFYKKLSFKYKGLNKIKCILFVSFLLLFVIFPMDFVIIMYGTYPINELYISIICLFSFIVIHKICLYLSGNIRWYSYFKIV